MDKTVSTKSFFTPSPFKSELNKCVLFQIAAWGWLLMQCRGCSLLAPVDSTAPSSCSSCWYLQFWSSTEIPTEVFFCFIVWRRQINSKVFFLWTTRVTITKIDRLRIYFFIFSSNVCSFIAPAVFVRMSIEINLDFVGVYANWTITGIIEIIIWHLLQIT